MYHYVFWKDVQDVLCRRKEENGNTFHSAFTEVFQRAAQETEELIFPDFGGWDCTDAEDLFELYCQLPITSADVGSPPIQRHINKSLYTYLFTRKNFRFAPCVRFETTFYNDDCFMMVYVLSGHGDLTVDTETISLGGGCLCIIAPNIDYRFYGAEDCVALYIMIWKKCFSEIFTKIFRHKNVLTEYYAQILNGQKIKLLQFYFSDTTQTYPLIRNMLSEYYFGDEYSNDLCTSLIEYFLILAVRESVPPVEKTKNIHENGLQTLHVLQYIHENHAVLTLEKLAAQFGYNAGYLSRHLKAATGKSFQMLLSEERIDEAKYLLRNSELSIEEIAFRVGYASLVSFSRRFSKDVSMSPSQYRQKHRTEDEIANTLL